MLTKKGFLWYLYGVPLSISDVQASMGYEYIFIVTMMPGEKGFK